MELDLNLRLITLVFNDQYRLICLGLASDGDSLSCVKKENSLLLHGDETFTLDPALSKRIVSYITRNYNLQYEQWFNRNHHKKSSHVSRTAAIHMCERAK